MGHGTKARTRRRAYQVIAEVLRQCLVSERSLHNAGCNDTLVQCHCCKHRKTSLPDEWVVLIDTFSSRCTAPEPCIGPVVFRYLVEEEQGLGVVLSNPLHKIGSFDRIPLQCEFLDLLEAKSGSNECPVEGREGGWKVAHGPESGGVLIEEVCLARARRKSMSD